MSSNSSQRQQPPSELLSLNQRSDPPFSCERAIVRRRVQRVSKIDGKFAATFLVVALAGVLTLGSALSSEATVSLNESASALLSRGNALAREGKPGPAILAYERAEQLAPRDRSIAANLRAERDRAGLAVPTPVWWQSAARALTMNEWAWSGSLALAFVCVATSLSRLLPGCLRKPVKTVIAVCAGAVLISIAALWLRWPELSRAVVVNSHVTALLAPADSAGPVFPLAEGEIVHAKKKLRNFVLVRTDDGRSGWISQSQIEPVIPGGVGLS